MKIKNLATNTTQMRYQVIDGVVMSMIMLVINLQDHSQELVQELLKDLKIQLRDEGTEVNIKGVDK